MSMVFSTTDLYYLTQLLEDYPDGYGTNIQAISRETRFKKLVDKYGITPVVRKLAHLHSGRHLKVNAAGQFLCPECDYADTRPMKLAAHRRLKHSNGPLTAPSVIEPEPEKHGEITPTPLKTLPEHCPRCGSVFNILKDTVNN